ncbi:MAG TPA: RNA polymerase sigma factor [Solirubrobacteraceae bacterium]|jgi:RNA polymerase sigma-70 factor (ECF subfamily)
MELPGRSKASDAELLALSVEDPEAFGLFYDRFERQLLAFFWRATRRSDIAADLTAEVFAAALESVASFRPELGSANAWLFGIARHALADAWSRGQVEDRARRRLGIEPLALDDELLERIEELDAHAEGVALGLLEDLPEDQRVAVQGRVIGELDYEELSEQLSCSQSVVRQRVSRGLRSMRARLRQTQRLEQTR